MSEATPQITVSPPPRRFSFKCLLVRAWALVILLVIVWTMVMAVVYMVRYVLRPAELPAWVVEGRSALQHGVPWSDLTKERGLDPVSHYHRVTVGLRPDPSESCTVSDCHQPLPHNRSKEVRAFANLHATFVACELCHDQATTGAVQAIWCDRMSARPRGTPASLLLMSQLEEGFGQAAEGLDVEHAVIVERLSALLRESGPDDLLQFLLLRIRSAEPGSPLWRDAVGRLGQEVANHATGEYGAKLALAMSAADRNRRRAQTIDLTREFRSSAKGSQQRKNAHREIHKQVLDKPTGCTACHGDEPGRIDYAALGYPKSREQALRRLPVAMLIQHNRQQQTFHLPGMIEQPQTRPDR